MSMYIVHSAKVAVETTTVASMKSARDWDPFLAPPLLLLPLVAPAPLRDGGDDDDAEDEMGRDVGGSA